MVLIHCTLNFILYTSHPMVGPAGQVKLADLVHHLLLVPILVLKGHLPHLDCVAFYPSNYLNGTLYKTRMDLFLVDSEEREIVKMQHLPVGRPVLYTFHPTLDGGIVIVIVIIFASIVHISLDPG